MEWLSTDMTDAPVQPDCNKFCPIAVGRHWRFASRGPVTMRIEHGSGAYSERYSGIWKKDSARREDANEPPSTHRWNAQIVRVFWKREKSPTSAGIRSMISRLSWYVTYFEQPVNSYASFDSVDAVKQWTILYLRYINPCPKLVLFLTPLQFVHLFCNLSKCILLFFSCISSLLLLFFWHHLL